MFHWQPRGELSNMLVFLFCTLVLHKWLNSVARHLKNPSQSYRASPAVWNHTALSATWHRWTRPAITSVRQAAYPKGMEGWVIIGVGCIMRWFICPHTVTHPSSNLMMVTRPEVEPTTKLYQRNACYLQATDISRLPTLPFTPNRVGY